MKRKNDFCYPVFILLVSVIFNVTYAETLPPNQIFLAGQPVRSDRLIVRFRNNQQTVSSFNQQSSLFFELGLKENETIRFNKAVPSAQAANQDLVFTILSMDKRTDLKTALKQLNEHPLIIYAEPDYIRQKSALPNDPEFSQLWGLDNQGQDDGLIDADINGPEAWDTSTDSSTIITGIIDTGVDYTHEDLAANIWINQGEIADDGIDNDNNGYVDDIHGIDCVNDDSDPMDDEGHGTHVAGTIGAEGDNGIGVAGVNWNTKIMALKFLDNFGSGFDSNAIECLAYAVNMKINHNINIRVTNNSWGGGGFNEALKDAIQASENANMLFVAAAGNSSIDTDSFGAYPSAYDVDNIISVAATTRTDNLASFSNFGATTVDLGAPGQGILSTIPGNQYAFFNGTSMAAPHVSGAAALLWENNPILSALEIKNKLMFLGDPIADLRGRTVSGHRLNLNSALNCIPGSPVLEILTPADQFKLLTGDDVTVQAIVTDCGLPITNIDVLALPGNGDATFTLFDDGQGEDTDANDGVYTGIWQLQDPVEAITLTVNADSLGLSASVTGKVLKNYKLDAEHPFQWIDASSGTRLNISDSDDGAETVTIGFDFEFYGVLYSEIAVGSNGILEFENITGFSAYINNSIPSNTQPNGFIAPYWDDLYPGESETAGIYSLLTGTAPNRSLTIAWVETLFFNESTDSPVTFEVTLYEGSNDIVFQYGNAYLADSATIGIEHQSGDFGLQYLFNGQNDGEPVQIQNEQAIRFFIDEDTPSGEVLSPTDDANNRATLGDRLAVSKWEHAFFKYEVDTPQNDITKATFRVYYEGHNPPLTLFVGAADDDWSEGTSTPPVTFIHNNPELQLSSADVTSPGYVEFDVTDYVLDPVNADGIVTLEVSSNQDGWNILSSKEGVNRPELVIETSTPPPLSTLAASDDANNLADLDGLLAVSKWEHAFFKFDATDIEQEVSKAILRVYYEARRAPLTLFVGAVDDDDWSESSGTPLRTFIHDRPELQLASVEGTAAGYVEFDVTDYVADQLSSDGDGIVTLEVSSNHDNWDILSSKEGEFPPELVIETGTVVDGPALFAGYSFEEGSGQAVLDTSGNENNGTLEQDAIRNSDGYSGEAIEFNGSNSYISLGTIDITSPSMSIALWFKADDFGTHDARLISKSIGTAESDHYWMVSTIRNGGQQKLRFRLKTANGGTATLIGSAALTPGVWTHVTATYDGAEMKLFQGGVEVGSLTKTGAISTSASVETWIGANPDNTRYFDGLIDDVRIYSESLDVTTIEGIMQGNLPLNN